MICSKGPNYPPVSIFSLDLKTHQRSEFPGSQGLFCPRISPDGSYLAALSQDCGTLKLYDFRTKRSTDWVTERGYIAYPTWSKDSRYLSFDNFMTDHPTSRRVKLGSTHSEELFSLSGLHRFFGTASGTWGGMPPDNSRLYVQDRSTQQYTANLLSVAATPLKYSFPFRRIITGPLPLCPTPTPPSTWNMFPATTPWAKAASARSTTFLSPSRRDNFSRSLARPARANPRC